MGLMPWFAARLRNILGISGWVCRYAGWGRLTGAGIAGTIRV